MMRRTSLKAQVMQALLSSIHRGDFNSRLPREKELCRQLGVGRNTLREAMQDLAAQGVIRLGGKGRLHQVLSPPALPKRAEPQPLALTNVRYLSSEPFHELGEITSLVYQTLTESFRAAGMRLVFECQPGMLKRFNSKILHQLTSQPLTSGWLLHRQTAAVQRWFAQSDHPAVVTGHVFPGISLPSVAYDVRAAARHAAFEFLRRGHRMISFVTPQQRTASEQQAVETFAKVIAERPGANCQLIEHGPDIESISRPLFASRMGGNPVTAYFIMAPDHAVTVLTLLLAAGVKIPRDVSLICMSGAKIMAAAVPLIAHYESGAVTLGKTAARLLDRRINGGALDVPPKLITPKFAPGDSLASPPT